MHNINTFINIHLDSFALLHDKMHLTLLMLEKLDHKQNDFFFWRTIWSSYTPFAILEAVIFIMSHKVIKTRP